MTIQFALWSILFGAAMADLPAVEINTAKGEHLKGRLSAISAEAAALKSEGANTPTSVPVAEILEMRFPGVRPIPLPVAGPGTIQVQFLDGSRLQCSAYRVASNEATLETALGKISLPVSAIHFVRFGTSTEKLDEVWRTNLEKEWKKDMLFVRKKDGDNLDYFAGVISGVDERVRFILEGDSDETPVLREKVYAMVYVRRAANVRKPTFRLHLTGGDVLQGTAITWDGSKMQATLPAGSQIAIPIDRLQSLDFSSGKVRFLSQMEPREVKYTPYIDAVWQHLSRDRNLHGGPLRLAGKTYTRGLSIHSRTYLKYRLAGDFSRFQAVCGIDQLVEGRGDVHVVLRGDGRVLHEADIRGTDAPTNLDLDVSGVRDLEILVDFGRNQDDIADHLDLADARVTK